MDHVEVAVVSSYMAEQSRPADHYYFFAYTVTITNRGSARCQLLTRHWIITDGEGRVEEVRGPGVVGAQPVLTPGESFTYTSACPLPTPMGSMCGSYQMVNAAGEHFDATIAPFALSRDKYAN